MLYQYKCIFSNRASNFDRGYNCTSLFLADKHAIMIYINTSDSDGMGIIQFAMSAYCNCLITVIM